MALNKPKYTLFKNTSYAIAGLVDITKHESSFKLQILLFVLMNIVAWNLSLAFHLQVILLLLGKIRLQEFGTQKLEN